MFKHMAKYSAANLLEQLGNKGFITGEELSNFVIGLQQENKLPLYLRALVGVGAFITCLCLIGFLSAAGIITNRMPETGLIIWGLIFVAGSVGLQRISGQKNTFKHTFIMQFSFASMMVGKTLFVLGIDQAINSGWAVTLGLLIITAITYHTYRMSIDRFLSSFAVLFSILLNILTDLDLSSSRELLLNGFFLLQFIGAATLLIYRKTKSDYIPLFYTFIFSLCSSVLFLASHTKNVNWSNIELLHPAFVNMVLTGGLIAFLGWTAYRADKYKAKPLILASIGAVLLGLISAPGILLSIGLMVLGYAKHEKLLIIVGALLMPIFLWLFYYNLDISLLEKSAILIGSGVVLLVGRFHLKHIGWDGSQLVGGGKRHQKTGGASYTKIMVILSVVVLAALNYGVYEKEQIKQHGETLLLELAPVDPRSLMQGDYMRLHYVVERNVPVKELAFQQKHGTIVVHPDENNVAQFIRFHKEENLGAGEKLIRFRTEYGQMQIVPNTFFFQEGHAKYYRDAEYGVFKFGNSRKYLLVGLADQARKTITLADIQNNQK